MFCALQFVWVCIGVGGLLQFAVGLVFFCGYLACWSCFELGFWLFMLVLWMIVTHWIGGIRVAVYLIL